MPYDPNLPLANTEIDAVQMRSQLQGLKALIDAVLTITAAQVDGVTTLPAGNPASVSLSVIGNTLHFAFGIPQGEAGPTGEVTTADMTTAITNAITGTSNNTNAVGTLGQSADFNYSQSQMQDVLNKLDEFLNAARR